MLVLVFYFFVSLSGCITINELLKKRIGSLIGSFDRCAVIPSKIDTVLEAKCIDNVCFARVVIVGATRDIASCKVHDLIFHASAVKSLEGICCEF